LCRAQAEGAAMSSDAGQDYPPGHEISGVKLSGVSSQQRVAIARSLAGTRKVRVLDERPPLSDQEIKEVLDVSWWGGRIGMTHDLVTP